MTKDEFEVLHEICRKEWLTMAKTGSTKHTSLVKPFMHSCPACEIARATMLANQPYEEATHKCVFCPVWVWRELDAQLGCTMDGQPYAQWFDITDELDLLQEEEGSEERNIDLQEELKGLARQIANLGWSWMKEYREVELSEKANQAIKDFRG